MKKKLVLGLVLVLTLAVSVMGLIACGAEQGKQSDGKNAQIYAAYKLYVQSEEEKGNTPMTYELWLLMIKGEKGDKGDKGDTGEKGDKGNTGDVGKSAYEIWLAAGHTGTEQDFLYWLSVDNENPQGLDFYPLPDGTYAVAFGKAWLLDEITIPKTYKGKNVSKIFDPYELEYRFYDKKIYFDGDVNEWIKMEKMIDYELSRCEIYINNEPLSEITELTLESIETIPSGAFSGFTGLKTLTIGSGVKNIEINAFNRCDLLESITVDEDNPNFSSQDGILYNKDKTAIVHVPHCISGDISLPNGLISIDYDFHNRTYLTGIVIPDSVESISYGSFYNCTSLKSVIIGSGVQNISNVFLPSCPIEYAAVPASLVSDLNKDTIKTLVITSGDSIESYALTSSAVENIIIGDSVKNIGYAAFQHSQSLINVYIGNGVENIGNYAFYNCYALTDVVIGDSVDNMNGAFTESVNIKAVYYKNAESAKLTVATLDPSLVSFEEYYYSPIEPTGEGNFWHYDIDGTTPVIWE